MPFVFLAVAGAIAFQGWRWWQAGEWWKTVLLGLGIGRRGTASATPSTTAG